MCKPATNNCFVGVIPSRVVENMIIVNIIMGIIYSGTFMCSMLCYYLYELQPAQWPSHVGICSKSAEAQKSSEICLRSHSWWTTEPRFKLSYAWFQSPANVPPTSSYCHRDSRQATAIAETPESSCIKITKPIERLSVKSVIKSHYFCNVLPNHCSI